MTENEKLRALLAEARAITQDSLDSNTTGFEAENEVCKCNACERYRSIIARIDAALAEPVDDDCGWHEYLRGDAAEGDARLLLDGAGRASRTGEDDLANAALYGAAAIRLVPRLSTERDEARAEVERLKVDVEALHAGIAAQDEVLTRRYNAQLSRANTAYQRGAEAMREAAIKACESKTDDYLARMEALVAEPANDAAIETRWAWHIGASVCCNEIRALPLPEDKR